MEECGLGIKDVKLINLYHPQLPTSYLYSINKLKEVRYPSTLN